VENGSGTILSTVYYVNQGFRKDRGDAGDEIALRLDGTGSVISRYLHGSLVDEVLAEENIGSGGVRDVLWAMTDHQGSVRNLARVTAGTASVVNHIVYDAFGKTVSETDAAIAHLYGYTGRELDKETGLQYNRARYLDLVLARWISQDPIGFGGGDANLYRYVGNHPNMATDPSGLDEISVPWMSGYDVIYTPEYEFIGLLGIGFQPNYTFEAFSIGKKSSDGLHVIMEDGTQVAISEIKKFAVNRKTGVGQTVKEYEAGEISPKALQKRAATLSAIKSLAPLPSQPDSIGKGLYNSVAKPVQGAIHLGKTAVWAVGNPSEAADRFFVPWDMFEAIEKHNMAYFETAFDTREGTAEFVGGVALNVTPWSKAGGMSVAAAERLPFTIVVDRSVVSMNGLGGIKIVAKHSDESLVISEAIRRIQTVGDMDFPSLDAARREAMRRYDIQVSKPNNFTLVVDPKSYKNPNLRGPNGEPSQLLLGTDLHGNKVVIPHHKWGHQFTDNNTYELPHFQGPKGEHLSYPR
jgi:RHS repeat-associated protein